MSKDKNEWHKPNLNEKTRKDVMSASFKNMKKNRMSFEDLANKMESSEQKSYGEKNPNLWYPELDKAKNGYAVIRFLPEKDTDFPWVKTFSHGFQVGNKWYIEECPTTIDGKCPVCEANSDLWATGEDANKKIASNRKRRQSWYANVLIVEDPKNPENEGQVKIFKFGFKIFSKIKDKLSPPEAFADEIPVNVCDFWEGADFKLKVRKVDGQVNYDSSSFIEPKAISENEDEIEAIWDKMHDISVFTKEDVYKSYEDLSKRFNMVTGAEKKESPSAEEMVNDSLEEKDEPAQKTETADQTTTAESTADADDTLDFFAELAKEDT